LLLCRIAAEWLALAEDAEKDFDDPGDTVS